MTAYAASYNFTNSAGTPFVYFTLQANSPFPVKLRRIDAWADGESWYYIYNYSGMSVSGGTSITPVPIRGGAPTATATVKAGGTASGTSSLLTTMNSGSSSFVIIGTGHTIEYAPGNSQWATPFDYIIPVGSGVSVAMQVPTNLISTTTFYWEELRLQWSV